MLGQAVVPSVGFETVPQRLLRHEEMPSLLGYTGCIQLAKFYESLFGLRQVTPILQLLYIKHLKNRNNILVHAFLENNLNLYKSIYKTNTSEPSKNKHLFSTLTSLSNSSAPSCTLPSGMPGPKEFGNCETSEITAQRNNAVNKKQSARKNAYITD